MKVFENVKSICYLISIVQKFASIKQLSVIMKCVRSDTWLSTFICVCVCVYICISNTRRDGVVSTATRKGLDDRGIEWRWGRVFYTSIPTGSGAPMGTLSLPGKRPWRGVKHLLPSSTHVKERIVLYLCSPSGPSRLVLGRSLPFTVMYMK
jgi:hypothetical protein